MNKIEFSVKFFRNVLAEGMVAKEAFILCAVAQLHRNGKEEVTSHDVGELVGDTHTSAVMKRMTWWLDTRESRNALNKKTFYHKLNQKGIEKLDRILP